MELLPRAPYEVSYAPNQPVIGFSFEAQDGSHAFATDKKTDFRAKPNGLAYVPGGCDVYSQSSSGGEYLKIVCLKGRDWAWKSEVPFSNGINRVAIDAAFSLRRSLLSCSNVCTLETENLLMVLESCVASMLGNSDQNKLSSKWMTSDRFRQVNDYIEAQIDTQLTVSKIASVFHVSAGFFSREFSKAIGQSPHQFIVEKRLHFARQLLMESRQELSSTAYACGFSSHSHMTELFRTRLGITPGDLRRSLLM